MVGNCVSFLRLGEPLNAFNAVISEFFYKLWNDNDWRGYYVLVLNNSVCWIYRKTMVIKIIKDLDLKI